MLYQLSYFRKLNFVIQKSERWVPRTGLEPACLSTHAPETCASTNSATWAYTTERYRWSEKRDSNPRPQPWQGCALPTELFSPFKISIYSSGTLSKSRAKNGTRTRDPNLGKVVLYQLSYFRNCECKDSFTFRFMQMVYYFFSSNKLLQNN